MSDSPDINTTQTTIPDRLITFVRIGISATVLIVALYVILSKEFPDDYNKWAFGMVGLVVGYWLR
jgi:hypothetical protein